MKSQILRLSTIVLLLLFIGAGCQKDELINEHFPFKLEYSIHNEQGHEVTQLVEGENFNFFFSIENLSDRDSPIYDHHLFGNEELIKIFKNDSDKKEVSFIGEIQDLGCDENLGCLGQANTKFEFEMPWSATTDSTVNFMCCHYALKRQLPLSIGKYFIKYTGSITYYYRLDNGEIEDNETGNYNLKYEFEIIK